MLERLNEVCDKLISLNDEYVEKYKIIKKVLGKKNAFINMDIEYAYSILRDLQVPEDELKDVYMELIDINNLDLDN